MFELWCFLMALLLDSAKREKSFVVNIAGRIAACMCSYTHLAHRCPSGICLCSKKQSDVVFLNGEWCEDQWNLVFDVKRTTYSFKPGLQSALLFDILLSQFAQQTMFHEYETKNNLLLFFQNHIFEGKKLKGGCFQFLLLKTYL